MLGQLQRYFSKKQSKYIAGTGLAVIIVIIAGLAWWLKGSENPERVYWDAVSNNLSTTSVTVDTSNSSNSSTLVQIDFGQHPMVRALTALSYNGSVVKTESLNTANADYTRYAVINSNTKNKSGKRVNFSSVVGLWALTNKTPELTNKMPQTFGQALLSLMLPGSLPLGNLTPLQRSQLIQDLKEAQVYDTAFSAVKKKVENGRLLYTYKISVEPLLYVQFLKNYAQDMGLHQLDQVDPNSYAGQPPLTAYWTIDVNSKELTEVSYGGHTEMYIGYGVPITTAVPEHPISGGALQQRLDSLLNQ